MAMDLLPLGSLGAVESNGMVTFGIWLPWVSDSDGNAVSVKIIHERDQFLQTIPPREFPLAHSIRAPYGDFWSVTVPIASTPPTPGSTWGATEASWRTPALQDLVFYEVNIAELGGDLERTRDLMAYLNDLCVNAI